MDDSSIQFIDKLYRDLYLSEEVKHHSKSKDKYQIIKEYISKLEDIHNRIVRQDHINTLKRMYYNKYVIKEEDIPESYYRNQEEMALERGFGHVILTDEGLKELNKILIEDQKKSLDTWIDYFLSSDSNYIPFWAKYWAFQGMLKLGSYNKETGKYNKRTKHTVTKFADLNREALALSIDTLLKYLNKKEINDKELEALIKTRSFGSIYTHITNKIINDNFNIVKRNKGKWIKYNQGSDHMPLVKSLQGYNTGWCTAGEDTAKYQLQAGDFYVYYTLDSNDEYKVPRIAIRMEDGFIGEIRGVAENQNLEPEMEEVVAEKIKDFPDKDEYYKKVNDMEKLTIIYKKYKNNEELSKEDLRFLYEIDSKIEGFGYNTDPRIREIIKNRDKRKDLALILSFSEEEIALSSDELTENTKYYQGNLITYSSNIFNKPMPEIVGGDFIAYMVDHLHDFKFPREIRGSLSLSDIEQASNIILPEIVDGSILFNTLIKVDRLIFPKIVNGNIELQYLKEFDFLKFPKKLNGDLDLCFLKKIGGKLILPEIIKGDLFLNYLEDDNLILPKEIELSLYLGELRSANNLVLPQKVHYVHLERLEECNKLVLPKESVDGVALSSLESHECLEIPDPLTYPIFLKKYIITPENVSEYRKKIK